MRTNVKSRMRDRDKERKRGKNRQPQDEIGRSSSAHHKLPVKRTVWRLIMLFLRTPGFSRGYRVNLRPLFTIGRNGQHRPTCLVPRSFPSGQPTTCGHLALGYEPSILTYSTRFSKASMAWYTGWSSVDPSRSR